MLLFAPTKMATRRASTLDRLTSEDRLMASLGHGVIGLLTSYPDPYGPPVYRAPSEALLAYYTRKRDAIRACYFRQRYGRDYWTGIPRHARAA